MQAVRVVSLPFYSDHRLTVSDHEGRVFLTVEHIPSQTGLSFRLGREKAAGWLERLHTQKRSYEVFNDFIQLFEARRNARVAGG